MSLFFKMDNKIYRAIQLMIIGFFCLIFLGSCSILSKNSISKNSGVKSTEFNLPVFLYPSVNSTNKTLVFLFSGDGGWIEFDDKLSLAFANNGFNTIGFNSRSYFWDKKTPKKTANDLAKLIKAYTQEYHCNKVILCGFSFGADVVPFIYNLLPFNLKNKVKKLVLLSPFASTDFEIHTSDLLNIGGDNREFKVGEEIVDITIPIFCFYGKEEKNKPLSELKMEHLFVKLLPGDHHYEDSSFQTIINTLKLKRALF